MGRFTNSVLSRCKTIILKFENDLPANTDIENDDQLDALVAWLLGKLWISGNDAVTLLGSRETGSMLLPNIDGLQHCWNNFNI